MKLTNSTRTPIKEIDSSSKMNLTKPNFPRSPKFLLLEPIKRISKNKSPKVSKSVQDLKVIPVKNSASWHEPDDIDGKNNPI